MSTNFEYKGVAILVLILLILVNLASVSDSTENHEKLEKHAPFPICRFRHNPSALRVVIVQTPTPVHLRHLTKRLKLKHRGQQPAPIG